MTLKSEMERILGEDLLREQERARFGIGQPDMVNSPAHYTDGGIETIDFIRAKLNDEQFYGYCLANALKYLSRAGKKGDWREDLKKARWYINRALGE